MFFSARQDSDQVTVLTILRWSMQLRGHETIVLGCDQAICNSCNSGSSPKLNKWQCERCFKYASLFHDYSGANIDWMKSLLINFRNTIIFLSEIEFLFSNTQDEIKNKTKHCTKRFFILLKLY